VVQHLPDRDGVLGVPAEFRPVPRHRVIEIQHPALGKLVHQRGHEGLAGREDQEQRVRSAAERPVEHHLAVPQHPDLGDGPARFDQAHGTAQRARIHVSAFRQPLRPDDHTHAAPAAPYPVIR
jgi:hypothetical protein